MERELTLHLGRKANITATDNNEWCGVIREVNKGVLLLRVPNYDDSCIYINIQHIIAVYYPN